MMEDIAKKAMLLWDLPYATIQLIACRENFVYRVNRLNQIPVALRIHRKGYRNHIELSSELAWLCHHFTKDSKGNELYTI